MAVSPLHSIPQIDAVQQGPAGLCPEQALPGVADGLSGPAALVGVHQITQISFYGRHLFAAASLPVRRRKDWPKICLVVTLGLGYRLDSPRVAAASEPYPGRWTHHILVSEEGQIDGELMGWLRAAWDFGESKR